MIGRTPNSNNPSSSDKLGDGINVKPKKRVEYIQINFNKLKDVMGKS